MCSRERRVRVGFVGDGDITVARGAEPGFCGGRRPPLRRVVAEGMVNCGKKIFGNPFHETHSKTIVFWCFQQRGEVSGPSLAPPPASPSARRAPSSAGWVPHRVSFTDRSIIVLMVPLFTRFFTRAVRTSPLSRYHPFNPSLHHPSNRRHPGTPRRRAPAHTGVILLVPATWEDIASGPQPPPTFPHHSPEAENGDSL